MDTLTRLRHAQKRIFKVQRRVWLVQAAFWPTVVLAGLGAGALLFVRQRDKRQTSTPEQPVGGAHHPEGGLLSHGRQ
jgi:hypothetical protein